MADTLDVRAKQAVIANLIAGTAIVTTILGSAFALTWLFSAEFAKVETKLEVQGRSLVDYAVVMEETVRRLEVSISKLAKVSEAHETVINNHEVRISILEAKSNEK